ncbi:MAG: molybdopterin-dependent oxidoreductase [Dorea sp.]|nr:molybdopterin-dependent oxidoreductase [Dorea sp.]
MSELKYSVCPYDCPDACGLVLEVEDGKLISTKGDPDHPTTRGFLCRKMNHYEQDLYNKERITSPYKRVGEKGKLDSFVPITWEEAVKTIANKWKEIIRTYGSDTIMPYSYAGTEGIIQGGAGEAFFYDLGGVSLIRTICGAAKSTGIAQVLGNDFSDWSSATLSDSDLIVLWGSNPQVNRLHVVPMIREAKKKGAKVILIDIYKTMSADLADQLILVKPASDGVLSLAMMHVLWEEGLIDYDFVNKYTSGYEELEKAFLPWTPEKAEEICGVKASVIRQFAREYANAKMPRFIGGSGMSRYTNGGNNCVLFTQLATLTGTMTRGGGVSGEMGSGTFANKTLFKKPVWKNPDKRVLNMNQLGYALTDKEWPVRSFYVFNSNPAVMAPDQVKVIEGLKREDLFTVVHDRFMTDTATYADIVLPATFSPEHDDIYTSYGHYHMQFGWKACEAPEGCKSNKEVFDLLAAEMGLDHEYWKKSAGQMMKEVLGAARTELASQPSDEAVKDASEFAGFFKFDITKEQLEMLEKGRPILLDQGNVLKNQTADGKINLHPPVPAYTPLKDQTYPLRFVVNHSVWAINSNFSYREELMDKRGKLTIWVNPADAEPRGIKDGLPCIAYNQFGRITTNVKVTEEVPAGTVLGSGVFQKRYTYGDGNFSSLLSEELTDLGQASTLNTQTVELESCRQ